MGSPPLTRGKGGSWRGRHRIDGITPAYAGKSDAAKKLNEALQDHPRLRGEKKFQDKKTAEEEGSPPLTRGKA